MKTVILALVLLGCGSPPPPPASPPRVHDWGSLKFTEVRAFRMNWDDMQSEDPIRSTDGTLNKTRLPKQGINLDASQIERLHQAVTISDEGPEAGCFLPHHAFVFYDAKAAIVATLNVCFICNKAIGEPEGLVKATNMSLLTALTKDLGLPNGNPKWSFR